MRDIGNWVMGIIAGLVGLIGLLLASRATDDTAYWFGLAFFLFAVLFVWSLIARATRGGSD